MIYLIGGPPRCGKTTIAKILAKKTKYQWVQINHFRFIVSGYYSNQERCEKFPFSYIKKRVNWDNDIIFNKYTSKELVKYYKIQASTIWPGLRNYCKQLVKERGNAILEGYHIQPNLIYKLLNSNPDLQENIKVVFLYRENIDSIIWGLKKGDPKSDWILRNTRNRETLHKVAKMISEYGKYTKKEAEKYNFQIFNTERHFRWKIIKAIKYLQKVEK